MEEGDLNSLIEGLGNGSGPLLVTQQNHYVVSNTFISAEQPFPTPSPSPSIILRSPASAVPPPSPQPPARSPAPSPARPNTPQSTLTQYSSIAPSSNQLVQLFPSQANSLVGRTQIIQATTTAQTAQLKGKQPQQILPKPLTPGVNAGKQAVARMAPTISQQSAPLLINQAQAQNPTLLLNQVLTSGGPVLVQPAGVGAGGTVHLMLRPPTPTLQSGPGPPQGKVVIGGPAPQQPTVLIQQNRQQVMRIMTTQGPMQVQQIQTPSGPQFIAIPTNQTLAFPPNSVLVPAPSPMQQQPPPQPAPRVTPIVENTRKKAAVKKPKPIKARSDSSTSPPSSREDLSPPVVSPKISVMASPMSSPPAPLPQKAITSSLRQIRPTAFNRKQNNEASKDGRGEEGGKPPVIDNLTATINSVAENAKSPLNDSMDDMLSGTQNLNLNKRPNLTIFQKARSDSVPTIQIDDDDRRRPPVSKKTPSKKKGKKDENKVDLWDLMKSAGIGDEEFEESPTEVPTDSLEITGADSDLLTQLQGSLRLAVGEDGRPLLIDGSGVLIPDQSTSQSVDDQHIITLKPQGTQTPSNEPPLITLTPQGTQTVGEPPLITLTPQGTQTSSGDTPIITLTPQALATAQSQLSQLLQDHGTVTAADQQLLAQIFTVNPSQGIGGASLSHHISSSDGNLVVNSRGTESEHANLLSSIQQQTASLPIETPAPPPPPPQAKVENMTEYGGGPPPGLPPLGPDALVITNNNGVPTLVASPALLQYLQTHQGIIQFQHDPVTKTIQPSLIIPHPPQHHQQQHLHQQTLQQQQQPQAHQPQQHQIINDMQIPRNDARTSPRSTGSLVKEATPANKAGGGQATSLANIVRNHSVASGVKMNMARIIHENPNLLQIAKETSSLITYKESCPTLTDGELAEIEKKIQMNKTVLDQCFHSELEKFPNVDISLVKGSQGTPSANSPNATNSDFQNKFLESIGMAAAPAKGAVSVGTGTAPVPALMTHQDAQPPPAPQQQPQPVFVTQHQQQNQPTQQTNKRVRKKKTGEKVIETPPQTVPPPIPPQGNLTFNIKQLTPEQNERLNIALNQRGITANQVAMCEMTEVEKQIIEEEIGRVTGGALGNATVKFFPPPAVTIPVAAPSMNEVKVNAGTMPRFYSEEDLEPAQPSAMVVNNPNLNQLLDAPAGTQLVSLGNPIHSGNQVVTLGAPPTPGSVIVGSNGNVVAIVHQAVQLTPQKQQMLKSIQTQMQSLQAKPNRTAADQATLQKLAAEQQKILTSGKIVSSSPHPSQPLQIVSSQSSSMQRVYQPSYVGSKPNTASVSCGTSTSDIGVGPAVPKSIGGKLGPPTILVADPGMQYGPLYVNPNSSNKNVTKCEKGTSPIQIQMGTQTGSSIEFRSSKMSTGTMTSPNTGKPQAVVAPAIVHIQQPEPPPPPVPTPTWVKQPQRRCPSPIIAVSRTVLIDKQITADQTGASRPDTHTPFLSKSDAVKRLMRYHVMDEKGLSDQDLKAADDMFEATSQHLLDKFRLMKDKYKYLLLMESMREVSTAERIMVDRNFVIEERTELEGLKNQERREQEEFEKAPPPLPPISFTPSQPPVSAPNPVKTDSKMIDDREHATLTSPDPLQDDLMSPGSSNSEGRKLTPSSSLTDSADISAQVQSAIDSILNLQQIEEPEDDRKKRKRPRTGAAAGGGKRGRRRDGDDDDGCTSDGDPALDEAIRSILAS